MVLMLIMIRSKLEKLKTSTLKNSETEYLDNVKKSVKKFIRKHLCVKKRKMGFSKKYAKRNVKEAIQAKLKKLSKEERVRKAIRHFYDGLALS